MRIDPFYDTLPKVSESCLPPLLRDRVRSTTLVPLDSMPSSLEKEVLFAGRRTPDSAVMVKVRASTPSTPPACDAAIYEAYAHKELAPKSAFVLPLLGACQGYGTCNVYLFTPLLEGDISRVIIRSPLRCRCAKLLFMEMAIALKVLHDAGLVHGDVKEQNYLVRRDGHIVIADFAALGPPGWSFEAGTWGYIAPERLTDESANSPASDIWALGTAFQNVLTLVRPADVSDREALTVLASRMIAQDAGSRPSIGDVLSELCLMICRDESPDTAPFFPS